MSQFLQVCQNCRSTFFESKFLKFFPKVRGETLEICIYVNVCSQCQMHQLDGEQMNVFRRASVDKFREMHNLLTSKEIVAYRERLGMSQSAFAYYLSVGEASIKRWETYYIQDKGQDEHIRLKCDEAYAEQNFLNIASKYERPDQYNGKKLFSLSNLNSLNEFAQEFEPDLYAHIFFFYSDFLHFKKHNRSITGMKYLPMKCGPCSYHSKCISNMSLTKSEKSSLKLDDQEQQTIQEVRIFFRTKGAKALQELSRQEKGYQETPDLTFIPYQFAKHLLITH